MNQDMSKNEPSKKKKKPLNKLVLVIVSLEIAGFLTAIGFFIAAIVSGIEGFDLASIGGSIFFGVVGSTMAFMMIGMVISVTKSRKQASSGYSSTISAADSPYTTKNYPEDAGSKKKVYYCSYCGYGTETLVGECPECGGPIKEK